MNGQIYAHRYSDYRQLPTTANRSIHNIVNTNALCGHEGWILSIYKAKQQHSTALLELYISDIIKAQIPHRYAKHKS